ncbi:MAG: tetratricopeptide repeat protein [Candidatus Latescibacterota bacterium]|nr:tetratricopeptide repeat protein [Candidatus Latescibacterota bacterium]
MRRTSHLLLMLLLCAAMLQAQDRSTVMREAAERRRAGDLAGAESLIRRFLETHPNDDAIGLSLGDLLAHKGEVEAAIVQWRHMISQVDPRPDHYVNVARRIRRLGRSQEALDLLIEGVEKLDDERPFLWDLGELYLETGNPRDAVRVHRQLVQFEPHRLLQILGLFDVMALQDQDGEASRDRWERYITPLQATNDRQIEPSESLLLAHALLASGQPKKGFIVLAKLNQRGLGPHVDVVTDGLIQFAQRSERLGYQQTVSRTYRLLAQITGDPSFSTTSLHRRARMHTRRGDLEGAITLYRQLVSAAARSSDVAAFELELADLLLSTHQAQQSHDILQRLAISRDLSERERLRALELLAESGWQRDDLQVVRNTLERLAQSPAGFAVASVGFTELAVLEGTVELGRPYADSLVTTKPETAQANDALLWLRLLDAHIESPDALQQFATGRLRLRQGRLDQATAIWQNLEQDGFSDLAHRLRITAARGLEMDEPAAAMVLYEQILSHQQVGGEIRFTATLALTRLQSVEGRVVEAIDRLQRLLLQWPDDPRVPIALTELQRLQLQLEQG